MSKAISFKIIKPGGNFLMVQTDEGAHFYDKLHYHPQIQITAIEKGEGMLYTGSNLMGFKEGDVFCLGSSIPHLIKSESVYFTQDSPGVKSTTIFIEKDHPSAKVFSLNELKVLDPLMQSFKHGIICQNENAKNLHALITSCQGITGPKLMARVLLILDEFANTKYQLINDHALENELPSENAQRLQGVINYTFKHFDQDITIDKVSQIAHLSRSQFSNFFKLHTRKTYISFLNEIRIEYAAQQIIKGNHTIDFIAKNVGFNHQSHFIRQFNKIKGITPSKYRSIWRELER